LKLGQHERGLDRFAEPYLVGKKDARCSPANERERRLELKREDINRCMPRGAELAMRAKSSKARLQISHPSSSGDNADSAAGLREDRAIKRVQEACAAPFAGAIAGCCQTDDDAVVECGRVFDEPSLATRNNGIAGGEGEWQVLQWPPRLVGVLLRKARESARSGHQESNRRAEM
jgi:hypothetical protein